MGIAVSVGAEPSAGSGAGWDGYIELELVRELVVGLLAGGGARPWIRELEGTGVDPSSGG